MSSSSSTASALANYSPISTLEEQYASPQRLLVWVRTNANCCLAGGVETLLKLDKGVTREQSTASISSSGSSFTPGSSSDPFAFLNDDSAAASSTEQQSGPKKKSIGNFLQRVAQQTSSHLERGMTGLAIRADQGRNPDLLVVALVDSQTNALLSMSERVKLPTSDLERLHGASFAIPLVVPSDIPLSQLTLQLWIQSGASLMLQAKKAKHYLLGSVALQKEHLQTALTHSNTRTAFLSVPLQSQTVVDGQLHLCIASDLKFPLLCGRGWSLTDPDLNGYTRDGLYHFPLDQSYGYSPGKQWFLATERATESSVVLPLATAFALLAQQACQISLAHATRVSSRLLQNRHDQPSPQKGRVHIAIGYLCLNDANRQAAASISVSWSRPDTIFQVELLPSTRLPVHTVHVQYAAAIQHEFYPTVCREGILPALLASYGTAPPPFLLGSVQLQVAITSPKNGLDPFGSIGPGSQYQANEDEIWQATLPLESYLRQQTDAPFQVPVVHSQSGAPMGVLILQLSVTMAQDAGVEVQPISSAGGLVSLVGLDSLMEANGSLPVLDFELPQTPLGDVDQQRRQQQLSTMGNFINHAYLQQHITNIRSRDMAMMKERHDQYRQALSFNPQGGVVPSYQDRTPKPFRPSSSRSEVLLSGIPFNVHVQSLTIENAENPQQGALFYNVTCGAPADHARGFGNIVSKDNGVNGATNSPVGPVSGGLRRLEAKRFELAKVVQDSQLGLIQSVATFFVAARKSNRVIHHIPARHAETTALRWKVFEATQALHHVTWACAVRRAHVFSQALGIAITTFLTSLSDSAKLGEGWPDLWVRHGYLVSYEGLLSAAGKELGMIEDASVGIGMLRMVSVVLLPDDPAVARRPGQVAVPHSPYVKWVNLQPSGVGSQTQYILEIGFDPLFYGQRIPEPLKNGRSVRMYPLLYQVGVDIRQWGAHTQMNVKNQLSTRDMGVNTSVRSDMLEAEDAGAGGLLDDEDDDVGATDNDVLIALNYEALRKMNAYAHAISPVAASIGGDILDTPVSNPTTLQVHPTLTSLHGKIMSSSGKMNHGILDEAAWISQKLGGGGVVFCKSGKDRTAMHVTYKQAQFARRYLQQSGVAPPVTQQSTIFDDATMMRVHGTRLPICEKNVGQSKYAFNSLQVKFMPDMLKPPPNTLAGFLKGGRVFGQGGIES